MPRAGETIRALREARGLTQEALAGALSEALGEDVSRAALASWEAGRRQPSERYRGALARVLGVDALDEGTPAATTCPTCAALRATLADVRIVLEGRDGDADARARTALALLRAAERR